MNKRICIMQGSNNKLYHAIQYYSIQYCSLHEMNLKRCFVRNLLNSLVVVELDCYNCFCCML